MYADDSIPECRHGNAPVKLVDADPKVPHLEGAAFDIGKAINPQAVEGQIEGGVAMGLGYALMEEVVLKDGYIQNLNFQDFLIPTILDVPKVKPIILEMKTQYGPYGAKGMGEMPNIPAAPAIISDRSRLRRKSPNPAGKPGKGLLGDEGKSGTAESKVKDWRYPRGFTPMRVWGSHYEMGYAHASLLRDSIVDGIAQFKQKDTAPRCRATAHPIDIP